MSARPGREMPTVPGFPAVRSDFWMGDETQLAIAYYGTAEDLIDSGVATVEMLAPGRPGLSRRDADGDSYWFSRYWRVDRDSQPYRYYRLVRWKRVEFLDRLPGALEMLSGLERYLELCAARREGGLHWREWLAQERARKRRQLLRLVIDNAVRP